MTDFEKELKRSLLETNKLTLLETNKLTDRLSIPKDEREEMVRAIFKMEIILEDLYSKGIINKQKLGSYRRKLPIITKEQKLGLDK